MTAAPNAGRLRSVLFAPAVRPDFIAKLPSRGADAVVIDCEDATPVGAKDEARVNARVHAPELIATAAALPRYARRPLGVFVRVNPPGTPWFADDMAHGLHRDLTGVVVPMVETVDGLGAVADALAAADLSHLGLIAGIETAVGVADARALLAHPAVTAAYFGAEDFVADVGGVRTADNHEVLYARSQVALAGAVTRTPVIDQVVTNFGDDDRFIRETQVARSLGYRGKLCIHPAQVALANEGFVPSADDVERARRLLDAYEAASARGVAAIDFEGQMVDEPLAVQARRLLDAADEPDRT